MILGAESCTHSWQWHDSTTLKCSKCQALSRGHDKHPTTARCFNCKKEH